MGFKLGRTCVPVSYLFGAGVSCEDNQVRTARPASKGSDTGVIRLKGNIMDISLNSRRFWLEGGQRNAEKCWIIPFCPGQKQKVLPERRAATAGREQTGLVQKKVGRLAGEMHRLRVRGCLSCGKMRHKTQQNKTTVLVLYTRTDMFGGSEGSTPGTQLLFSGLRESQAAFAFAFASTRTRTVQYNREMIPIILYSKITSVADG